MQIDKMRLKALKLPQPNPTNEKRKENVYPPKKKLSKKEQLQEEQDKILFQRLKDFYGFN